MLLRNIKRHLLKQTKKLLNIKVKTKISQVNDTIVHLLIASVVMPDQPGGTSLVLAGVIRVCEEMGVHYSIEK